MDNTFNKILFEIMEYHGQTMNRLKLYTGTDPANETATESAARNTCTALLDLDLTIANQLLSILDDAKTPHPAKDEPT